MNTQPTRVKFRPTLRHGQNGPERLGDEIEGERVDFGLVLHPTITAAHELTTTGEMSISCPVTGCFVVGGDCRESALRHLDELVRRKGGFREFDRELATARRRIERRRAQVEPPLPSPTADVHAVICPHEAKP